MSEIKDNVTKLKEEVVVNEVEKATQLVELEKEAKKTKVVKVAKKAGKIAAIAGIGLLGFFLGRKTSSKYVYDDSEVIDVDYETNSDEE